MQTDDPFSAELFHPAAIDDDVLAENQRVETLLDSGPARWELDVEIERAMSARGGVFPDDRPDDLAETRMIPGAAGDLGIRVFVPTTAAPAGVYLHFHGGGFCLGSASSQDLMLRRIAECASVAVISVEYRLAPENPYPAANVDCETAALWLVKNATQEFGCERIIVGGESAGALLAVSTALRMRDRHGYHGFAGVNLSQGGYDLRLAPGARLWGERRLVLTTRTLQCHLQRYLQDIDPNDPQVSPFLAPLHDMPPALFTIGTLDPLLEDNMFMYARWRAAGAAAEIAIYPGGIHGFTLMETKIAQRASERMNLFIANTGR